MKSTVRQESRKSLKERNGIELSMNTDSVTTRTEMMIGENGSFPVSVLATTIEIKMAAAAGIGKPCVYLPGAFG